MSATGFNANGTAYETCRHCGGAGARWFSVSGLTKCRDCHGSGRVPVPMRGLTDPTDEDLARAKLEERLAWAERNLAYVEQRVRDGNDWRKELETKLETARKALEAIAKHPVHPDRLAHCLSWSREIAAQAIKDIS